MTAPTITEAGLAQLLAFRDDLPGRLPAFIAACSEQGFILPFDWLTWGQGDGRRFATIAGLRTANLDECRQVLTVQIRQDRFIENSMVWHVASGFLGALHDRMAAYQAASGLPQYGPDHSPADQSTTMPPRPAPDHHMPTDTPSPPSILLHLSGRHSVYREKIVEHYLVSRLLIEEWRRGTADLDVLHPEIDRGGYDLVLQRGPLTRYIQLKSSLVTGKAADQSINLAFLSRPGGCVIWVLVHEDLEIASFLVLIPKPDESIADSLDGKALKISKHSKANAQGIKTERPHLRDIPRARFQKVTDIPEVMNLLFPLPSTGS